VVLLGQSGEGGILGVLQVCAEGCRIGRKQALKWVGIAGTVRGDVSGPRCIHARQPAKPARKKAG
jgi:hypothetical protein